MNVAIIGAGAVGGVLAGRLAAAQRDVLLVARGAQYAALRENPLRLKGSDGEFNLPVVVTNRLEETEAADILICAVKSYSLPALARQLKRHLRPNTTVVCVVNGIPWWYFVGLPKPFGSVSLDTVDSGTIVGDIPVEQVVGCVVYIGASCGKVGTFNHDFGGRWVFGEPSGVMSERLQRLVDCMSVPGFAVQTTDTIRDDIFAKLATNVSFNALSALTLSTVGQLLDDPRIRELLVCMMEECRNVAAAIGASKGPPPDLKPFYALASMRTSMLQDLEAGRALEVDGIVGAVCEIGARFGVAVPNTDLVYSLLTCLARSTGTLAERSRSPAPQTTDETSAER